MKISTRGRYALRMLVDLAENQNDSFVPLKDIAARQEISKKYLEQIASNLTKQGILVTNRGFQGGYRLKENPSNYTVGDILRTTEGNLAPVSCLDSSSYKCDRVYDCKTLYVWKGLNNAINQYLDSITLQDIVDKNIENSKYNYI